MTINKRQTQNKDLFNSNNGNEESTIKLRDIDPGTSEGELQLRLIEVNKKIKKLEKAQEVSQKLLESTIRV